MNSIDFFSELTLTVVVNISTFSFLFKLNLVEKISINHHKKG